MTSLTKNQHQRYGEQPITIRFNTEEAAAQFSKSQHKNLIDLQEIYSGKIFKLKKSNYIWFDIDLYMYRWNKIKMSESERFAHMFDKSIGLVRRWSEIRVGLMAA